MKEHLEEIAPFFARDNRGCKEMFEKDVFYHIFSWQCGHQRRINVSSYGLDAAFPGQIQSALLRLYRYISRLTIIQSTKDGVLTDFVWGKISRD